MISPTNTSPGLTRRGRRRPTATGASRRCTTRPASATTSGCRPATTSREPPSRSLAKRLALERVYLLHERSRLLEGAAHRPVPARGSTAGRRTRRVCGVRSAHEELPRARGRGRALRGGRCRRRRRPVRRRRSAREGATRTPRRRGHAHGRLLLHSERRGQAHRPGRSRHVRDDGRPAARHPPAQCRRPALQARHRRPGHAVPGRDGGRAGRGSRAGRDRSLRRDARLGAPPAVRQRREGRHPRHLPLRPQR